MAAPAKTLQPSRAGGLAAAPLQPATATVRRAPAGGGGYTNEIAHPHDPGHYTEPAAGGYESEDEPLHARDTGDADGVGAPAAT